MQINLSEKTVDTVIKALKSSKSRLEKRLIDVELGRASKEVEPIFKKSLEDVEDALAVFEELSGKDS